MLSWWWIPGLLTHTKTHSSFTSHRLSFLSNRLCSLCPPVCLSSLSDCFCNLSLQPVCLCVWKHSKHTAKINCETERSQNRKWSMPVSIDVYSYDDALSTSCWLFKTLLCECLFFLFFVPITADIVKSSCPIWKPESLRRCCSVQ